MRQYELMMESVSKNKLSQAAIGIVVRYPTWLHDDGGIVVIFKLLIIFKLKAFPDLILMLNYSNT